ncbi:MAG: MOSC domain-containing protein [Candidatus Eremiobacteraeota bacterium]|nr:MOSC domain-containing protein [Candidatus Eremiobacteraeota bacterium]
MNEPAAQAQLISVNVGATRTFYAGKRSFESAIGKRPVAGRVVLRGVNLAGDDQADRNAHGGPDRALYAYAREDYRWWEAQLERALEPGLFGENLTVGGIDVSGALVGEEWRVGEAVLRVTSPRIPCYKLAHVVGEPDFVKRFAQAHRPGAYLAVVTEGDVAAGDRVEVTWRPPRGLALDTFTRIYFAERELAAELLEAPGMTAAWREWAQREIAERIS